ncbi:hypothetical protein [Ruegeria hyattellae]|uniref:hypothetical protein n=1 Tax=Ruegeria hyattellae TaxID=3233337 RepID=UPI00355C46A4
MTNLLATMISNRKSERWSLDFQSDSFGASRKFRNTAMNDKEYEIQTRKLSF